MEAIIRLLDKVIYPNRTAKKARRQSVEENKLRNEMIERHSNL
ncbi:hypothetical protein [Alkalicoccus urumqiensis]|nr:hypothetical protein [Alkalicoccus urumqiensis]